MATADLARLEPGQTGDVVREAVGEPTRIEMHEPSVTDDCEPDETGFPGYRCGVTHVYALREGGEAELRYSARGVLVEVLRPRSR